MPDIQEAKCYDFTVRIFLGAPRGGGAKKNFALRANLAPP